MAQVRRGLTLEFPPQSQTWAYEFRKPAEWRVIPFSGISAERWHRASLTGLVTALNPPYFQGKIQSQKAGAGVWRGSAEKSDHLGRGRPRLSQLQRLLS